MSAESGDIDASIARHQDSQTPDVGSLARVDRIYEMLVSCRQVMSPNELMQLPLATHDSIEGLAAHAKLVDIASGAQSSENERPAASGAKRKANAVRKIDSELERIAKGIDDDLQRCWTGLQGCAEAFWLSQKQADEYYGRRYMSTPI